MPVNEFYVDQVLYTVYLPLYSPQEHVLWLICLVSVLIVSFSEDCTVHSIYLLTMISEMYGGLSILYRNFFPVFPSV